MLADPAAPQHTVSLSLTDYTSNLGDYSQQVLSIMNTLGIDRQRTIEVRGGRDGGREEGEEGLEESGRLD